MLVIAATGCARDSDSGPAASSGSDQVELSGSLTAKYDGQELLDALEVGILSQAKFDDLTSGGEPCPDEIDMPGGFAEGTDVTVRNGDGQTLAVGSLADSRFTTTSGPECIFEFEVAWDDDGSEFFEVEIGGLTEALNRDEVSERLHLEAR